MREARVDRAAVGEVQPTRQVHVATHPEGVELVLLPGALRFYGGRHHLHAWVAQL